MDINARRSCRIVGLDWTCRRTYLLVVVVAIVVAANNDVVAHIIEIRALPVVLAQAVSCSTAAVRRSAVATAVGLIVVVGVGVLVGGRRRRRGRNMGRGRSCVAGSCKSASGNGEEESEHRSNLHVGGLKCFNLREEWEWLFWWLLAEWWLRLMVESEGEYSR